MARHGLDSALLDEAIVFATRAHAGQERKGAGYPYVVHCLEAVSIVATMTSDRELLAAAVLHDVIEDCGVTRAELAEAFGERVADLVDAETEQPLPAGMENTWHNRRAAQLARQAAQSRACKMVALGDKLSNMRAIARDYERMGEELWQRFGCTDPAEHAWRYRGLVDAFDELSDTEAWQEFRELVERTFPA